MNLFEILDTKIPIKWSQQDNFNKGAFKLDDDLYEIQLNEYDCDLPSGKFYLVDFGFTINGSWEVSNKNKASKVFGAVLNGLILKIKELKPDGILFGVNYRNGSVESRKSFYERLAKFYSKGSSYHLVSDWIKTKNGEYQIMSKKTLTKDDLEYIENFAKSIELKD